MKKITKIIHHIADSLYGESGDVISTLEQLGLRFLVAIRSNDVAA